MRIWGRPIWPKVLIRRPFAWKANIFFGSVQFGEPLWPVETEKEAENEVREAIQISLKNWELHHSLGLLLAEERKFNKAAKYLRKAARLTPYRLRVHYNQWLTLQRLVWRKEDEGAFINLFWLNQKVPRTLQALAVFYMKNFVSHKLEI